MAELQKKAESDTTPAPVAAVPPPSNDAVAKKAPEVAADDSKALVVVPEKTPVPENKPSSKGPLDRDVALAELEKEKRLSYVKAWEESEKSKTENKAQKNLSDVCCMGKQ
uniref:Remorin N-terminal domain-containing protein n=1 Tax=Lotus japonicus TaxID=34305 RepID=I3SEX2_LOTJA|nr:unknown [Lotus japonicus]